MNVVEGTRCNISRTAVTFTQNIADVGGVSRVGENGRAGRAYASGKVVEDCAVDNATHITDRVAAR